MSQPRLCGRCGAPIMVATPACGYCGVAFEGFAPPPPAAPAVDPEILRLLAANNKIEAIKAYRQRTGVGLREAKDAVEEIEARLRRR